MQHSEHILEMRQLRVASRAGKPLLEVEHFAVRYGEQVAVVGPNGAGKSTLLRTINLLHPYSGELHLFGEDARHADKVALRRRSALVFQETLLLNESVFDNIAKALRLRGVAEAAIKPQVAAALSSFGCAHLAQRSAHALSGGEAKRVCIARGLVADAALLLLDEPSAALDVSIRAETIEQIRQLARARGATVILVSHNFTDILQFAERVIAIIDGRIVQDTTLETLIRRPATEQLARLVGMDNIIPCQVEHERSGCLVTLANGIRFVYPQALRKPISACCLPGDAFELLDTHSASRSSAQAVVIEGHVERVLPGIGLHNLWVRVGQHRLVTRIPRSGFSSDLDRHGMVRLVFNPADAHFV